MNELFKSILVDKEAESYEVFKTIMAEKMDAALNVKRVAVTSKYFNDRTTELEESQLTEAPDGYIAIFNGKKLEITKDQADSLYAAKKIAIKTLKVPKSKIGLLAIKPAYNESTELEEGDDIQTKIDKAEAYLKTLGGNASTMKKYAIQKKIKGLKAQLKKS
jgi:hypothetical protein